MSPPKSSSSSGAAPSSAPISKAAKPEKETWDVDGGGSSGTEELGAIGSPAFSLPRV
jgi:hypothetical protein